MNNLSVIENGFTAKSNGLPENTKNLFQRIVEVIEDIPVFDLHTHLFAPQFSSLNLYQFLTRSDILWHLTDSQ